MRLNPLILLLLMMIPASAADVKCYTQEEAQAKWPKSRLYWHNVKYKCWDNVKGGNKYQDYKPKIAKAKKIAPPVELQKPEPEPATDLPPVAQPAPPVIPELSEHNLLLYGMGRFAEQLPDTRAPLIKSDALSRIREGSTEVKDPDAPTGIYEALIEDKKPPAPTNWGLLAILSFLVILAITPIVIAAAIILIITLIWRVCCNTEFEWG